ncbi:18S rRNA biogenesis protein [Dendrothele bispora CBS 962.96]|uniref:18S rRNA biogenesis protein n=1 Tax=Dendrothele bispora (strain CBS 962.96) TaxID=1314807 RepID=A0A4S8LH27_DENBC|nr:18S rRNA biogenesis protein [Dendrothele bispora CBS 962.96]THU89552.1 18S rRNA biogenesis protein [Dendrothele bispora CBS 962.96]
MAQKGPVIHYSGHQYLRSRLVLSILSGKSLRIEKIRSDDKNPGLGDFEISLLRLLEKITNGTVVEISVTGTAISLKPGIISGGSLVHDCSLSRSIGYFLEPVILLAPFAKKPVQLTLRGITTDQNDLSADLIRTVTLPHLQLFGISDGLELRIKKRGAPPAGGGEVQFLCPIVKQVKTLNFVEPGKVKRIRGIAHAVRVNPQFSNRMIEATRSILNRYIPDIYLYSDVYKGDESGKSPGYALSLLAESTTSAIHCSEAVSEPGVAPEDIALRATRALLAEIQKGGCVDQKHQTMVLLMMVLGSEDVGRCRMGPPTTRTIQFLRDVREFFGTSFKIVPAEPSKPDSLQLTYSCYGTGYVNSNRTLA